MRDNVDQPQGCGEREGMCAWCKPDMHTCVAPLSRERVKERERERGDGKQNLHGNSVPVGRVELWVFNAVLSAPFPFSLFLSTYVLPPSSTSPSYTHFSSLSF